MVQLVVTLILVYTNLLKDVFGSFLFFRYFYFFIYIYCKKFNAEFNKLIKTVGHHALFI